MKSGRKYVRKNGTQTWKLNGMYHRLCGPARIWTDGSQFWWVNGERHRIDGPAIIRVNSHPKWYVNGNRYFDNKSFQAAAGITDEEMSFMIIKYGDVE